MYNTIIASEPQPGKWCQIHHLVMIIGIVLYAAWCIIRVDDKGEWYIALSLFGTQIVLQMFFPYMPFDILFKVGWGAITGFSLSFLLFATLILSPIFSPHVTWWEFWEELE
jgi:hypothetical protein